VTPPRVLVTVPDGWPRVAFAPPDLSHTGSIQVLAWEAWGPSPPLATGGGLVAACMARDTGTWTPEAEPLVLERLDALVSSTALRMARIGGQRVVTTERDARLTSQRLEGAGDAEHLLAARTFLGFVGGRDAPSGSLVGCFALCVADLPRCGASIEKATMSAEFVPPPPATLALRAVVSMVQHPSLTLAVALSFSLLACTALVVTRRRPRTK
jgi:hypothetical protein